MFTSLCSKRRSPFHRAVAALLTIALATAPTLASASTGTTVVELGGNSTLDVSSGVTPEIPFAPKFPSYYGIPAPASGITIGGANFPQGGLKVSVTFTDPAPLDGNGPMASNLTVIGAAYDSGGGLAAMCSWPALLTDDGTGTLVLNTSGLQPQPACLQSESCPWTTDTAISDLTVAVAVQLQQHAGTLSSRMPFLSRLRSSWRSFVTPQNFASPTIPFDVTALSDHEPTSRGECSGSGSSSGGTSSSSGAGSSSGTASSRLPIFGPSPDRPIPLDSRFQTEVERVMASQSFASRDVFGPPTPGGSSGGAGGACDWKDTAFGIAACLGSTSVVVGALVFTFWFAWKAYQATENWVADPNMKPIVGTFGSIVALGTVKISTAVLFNALSAKVSLRAATVASVYSCNLSSNPATQLIQTLGGLVQAVPVVGQVASMATSARCVPGWSSMLLAIPIGFAAGISNIVF